MQKTVVYSKIISRVLGNGNHDGCFSVQGKCEPWLWMELESLTHSFMSAFIHSATPVDYQGCGRQCVPWSLDSGFIPSHILTQR